eukprot:sb/3477077/
MRCHMTGKSLRLKTGNIRRGMVDLCGVFPPTKSQHFHGHNWQRNGRFMGGLTRDKKSYLAPFSRYLNICAPTYDFMHILNISTSDGPRTFFPCPGDCRRQSPGMMFLVRTC